MKTTVSVIKADIGSVSGHCVAHPDLMDICDEVLAEALETNILTDYYISRCGDDIDLIMTHRNGEENEEVHKTAYNAFMKATERARELKLYGAGQDLLSDTFSGNIKIIVSQGACDHTNTSNVTLTLTLTGVGNTFDNLTTSGTNTWVGHVYNWLGTSPPPGGSTSPATPQNTFPFQNTNYVGYYNVSSESLSENFGGDNVCFPVLSNGINRTNIRTQGFAVRYRMLSTRPAGCYIISMRGDDGIRLYNDGALVFSEWKQQSPTNYNNVLVYLDGNAELIFDFYEYSGQNVANLIIQPFDPASNTVATPANINYYIIYYIVIEFFIVKINKLIIIF